MGSCWLYAWHLCIKCMQSMQPATYWHSNVHVAVCLYNPFQRHIRCWYNAECFQWRSSIERNWHDRALVINCVYLYRSIFSRMRHKCLARLIYVPTLTCNPKYRRLMESFFLLSVVTGLIGDPRALLFHQPYCMCPQYLIQFFNAVFYALIFDKEENTIRKHARLMSRNHYWLDLYPFDESKRGY